MIMLGSRFRADSSSKCLRIWAIALFLVLTATRAFSATPAVTITAESVDGNNSGTARLGMHVTFVTSVTGTTDTAITWTLQGAGSITSAGLYSAPAAMPASATAVVTATLTDTPSIHTSYSFSIVNPSPGLSGTTPATIPQGSSTTVSIWGGTFVPGAVAYVNGTAVSTTYVSATQVNAVVPAPASTATSLAIKVSNPTPGGGTSAALTVPVSAATLKINAASVDGNNSGTARLGMHVSFTATLNGTATTAVTYSLNGAGSITAAGLYTAPATMPANSAATVTATTTSTPSVSTTYSFAVVNPAPGLSGTTPTTVAHGASTSVSIWGGTFVPGAVAYVNGTAVSTTYVSATQVNAVIPTPSSSATSVALTVGNPTPGGGTSAALSIPVNGNTLKINASSVDGTNTGTARLGMHVSFAATLNGAATTAVTYSLSGAGSITSAGLYSAPATMPSSTAAVVTATTTTTPASSTTYSFSIINPSPGLSSTQPTTVATGSSSTLSIFGGTFVPGAVAYVNGAAVATTYVSATEVKAVVPAPSSSATSVAVTVANPTPGGGTSTALSVPVTGSALKITASSVDGANTGTARLGMHVSFVATLNGTTTTAVTYTLSGAGSVTSAGLYSAPATMPANTTATITATSTSTPSISTTYTFSIVNPVPAIASASPSSITATSTSLALFGANMVPSTVVLVNGSAVPTTYVAVNEVVAQVTATAGQSTALSVAVQNPAPGGGMGAAISVPVAVPGNLTVSPATFGTGSFTVTVTGSSFNSSSTIFVNNEAITTTYVSSTKLTGSAFVAPWVTTSVLVGVGDSTTAPSSNVTVPVSNTTAVSYDAAARFSMEAAFGPRPDIVAQIQSGGFQAFLTSQFAQPVSTYPAAIQPDSPRLQFFINATSGSDLLRQRVAFALEDFIAIAVFDGDAAISGTPWQEMMEKDAFGNFRTLMNDVTLNTTMGRWLDMANNWAPTSTAIHPNQNYARELLQLFTMGPVELNDDGSEILDANGNPIPNYDDSTVLALSRALTGWALPAATSSAFSDFGTDFSLPLVATDSQHDHLEKTIFDTVTMPAGQTIQQDLKQSLDTIFANPSVPPFISRLLIQNLVKSDPSPAYIERISHVFEDDGTGVRGNLQAVVQAILLDTEARAGDSGTVADDDGHLNEPILYFLSVMSGTGITPANTAIISDMGTLGEYLWQPVSVFSFFSPSFNVPGTAINAPEWEIYDGNYMMQRSQILYNALRGTQNGFTPAWRPNSWLMTHFSSPSDLLDAVNHMYYHGTMTAATKAAILNYTASVPDLYTQQLYALYLSLNSDTVQVNH